MKGTASRLTKVTTAALLLACASSAWAAGYAVWEMGTRSSAMGGVLTASAEDPTAVFYNPAGLGWLEGRQATLDFTVINPYTEFSGVDPNPGFGVTERLDDPVFFLPQAYVAQRLNEQWSAGLGFYTPYGLAVEWQDPASYSGRYIATKTELRTYFVSPTVAFAPTDRVRAGLGLNLVKGSVELNQNLVENLPNATELGKAKLSGDSDWAVGFNAGLMVDVAEHTTLGFSYKSEITLDFTGDAAFTALVENAPLPPDGGVTTSLPLPSLFSLGVASQVNDRLLLEFNYNRIQWSTFDMLEFNFTESPENDKSIREDYVDTSQYRFGAEFVATPELALRGGFVYDESPQPSGSVGPVLPDADRKGVSIGAGYQLGDVELDVYNLFLFFADREIRDNWDGYDGDYQNYTNLFGLGLTYHF
jgi:long-chain fatty acid transport protein